jgi:hypothetical protein
MKHFVMLTEARTEEARRIRRQGKDPRRGKELVPRKDQLVGALQTSLSKDHYVLVTQKSTPTPAVFTRDTSPLIKTMETSQKSTPTDSPTSTLLSEASLARLLVSLESAGDLKIPEGRSSLTLREYCEQNDLDYSSLKTLKGFSATTTEQLSQPSSPRLVSWGMTSNGKCLTAKITEYPKTVSVFLLSDILEENPDPKYFLSEKSINTLRLHAVKRGKRFPLQLERNKGDQT